MLNFRATYYFPSLDEVDPAKLRAKGIRFMIIDMDNTLIPSKDVIIPERTMEYVQRVKDAGITAVVVSNNVSKLTEERCRQLGLGYFSFALKPLPFGFHKALRQYGFQARETVVIGDQIVTDILGGNHLHMMTILIDPVSKENHIFGKITSGFSDAARILFHSAPRKGDYYGKL